MTIEIINNKFHGLSPPGGFVSPSGGFASLSFDQAVCKNSQRHLADRNAICILHRSDCAWLCCLLSQWSYRLKYDKKPNANARHKILILNGI